MHPANAGKTLKPPSYAIGTRTALAMMGGTIDWKSLELVYPLLHSDDSDLEIFIACLVTTGTHQLMVARLQQGG